MRDRVFVEGLALGGVTVPLVELLRAEPRVEDDHAIVVAARPCFGKGEEPRSNAVTPLALRHRHLLELQRVRAEQLEGN